MDDTEPDLRVGYPGTLSIAGNAGSQFTSDDFTGKLEKLGIAISMDGRGRALDNIFVERLWRTVKYEEVYLKSYETVAEARESLARYFHFYNTERLHEALGYRTPREVYFEERRLKEGSETKQTQAPLHQTHMPREAPRCMKMNCSFPHTAVSYP